MYAWGIPIFIAPFPGDEVQKAKMAVPKSYCGHQYKNRSVLVSFNRIMHKERRHSDKCRLLKGRPYRGYMTVLSNGKK